MCKRCEHGKSQPRVGWVTCHKCNAGYFARDAGRQTCSACPSGTFTNTTGALKCSFCPTGKFGRAKKDARSSCAGCKAGRVSLNRKSCAACAPGRFAKAAMARHCEHCPPGMTQAEWGQHRCNRCGPGKMARSVAKPCTACVAGRFSRDFSGWGKGCPAGRFTVSRGHRLCSSCPAGQSANRCATRCTSCLKGRYAKTRASQTCAACAPARFSAWQGSTTCARCPLGHVSARARQSCHACPEGTMWSTKKANDNSPVSIKGGLTISKSHLIEPCFNLKITLLFQQTLAPADLSHMHPLVDSRSTASAVPTARAPKSARRIGEDQIFFTSSRCAAEMSRAAAIASASPVASQISLHAATLLRSCLPNAWLR